MGASMALFVSLPVAFVVAGLMGVALEVVLIRRLYGRPLDTLLVTWGVALMLLPTAAPNSKLASRLEAKNPKSHVLRHP